MVIARWLVALMVLVTVAACSQRSPAICQAMPDPEQLGEAERRALADAMTRFGERCKRADSACEVRIRRNGKEEILVAIATVYIDEATGNCGQIPGDLDLSAYSAQGKFISREMSL